MAACSNLAIDNGSPTGLWSYATVGGSIQLSGMPQQALQWAGFAALHPCEALRFVSATHLCAYNCFFSKFAGDNNNSCLLWDTAQAGGVGTYCGTALGQFPVSSGPQYPYLSPPGGQP
jgi:hypothetical protein